MDFRVFGNSGIMMCACIYAFELSYVASYPPLKPVQNSMDRLTDRLDMILIVLTGPLNLKTNKQNIKKKEKNNIIGKCRYLSRSIH